MSNDKPDTPETPNPAEQQAPEVPQPAGIPYEPAVPKEVPQDDPMPGADRKGD